MLQAAIEETPAASIRDGGVIARGYDSELDDLRDASTNADAWLDALQQRERDRTGIATLKVGYNRVHGFYIEIGRSHADSVPAEYTRRQTLKSAERYITEELKTFEDKVLSARERFIACFSSLARDAATAAFQDRSSGNLGSFNYLIQQRIEKLQQAQKRFMRKPTPDNASSKGEDNHDDTE